MKIESLIQSFSDYSDNRADKPKSFDWLKSNGYILIPMNVGFVKSNLLHVTSEAGLRYIEKSLGKIQISCFNRGYIGHLGDLVLHIKGRVNAAFETGDAGTQVGVDGLRYYNPKNIASQGIYNELVVVPLQILDVYPAKDGDILAKDYLG